MVMSTVSPVCEYHRIRLTIALDDGTILPVWRYHDDGLVSRRGGMLRDSIDCHAQRVLSISSIQEDRSRDRSHGTLCDDAPARCIADDDRDRLDAVADTPYRCDDECSDATRELWYHDQWSSLLALRDSPVYRYHDRLSHETTSGEWHDLRTHLYHHRSHRILSLSSGVSDEEREIEHESYCYFGFVNCIHSLNPVK